MYHSHELRGTRQQDAAVICDQPTLFAFGASEQVLLAADLTPYEGIGSDEDEAESTSAGNDNSRDNEGSDGMPNGEESLSRRQVTHGTAFGRCVCRDGRTTIRMPRVAYVWALGCARCERIPCESRTACCLRFSFRTFGGACCDRKICGIAPTDLLDSCVVLSPTNVFLIGVFCVAPSAMLLVLLSAGMQTNESSSSSSSSKVTPSGRPARRCKVAAKALMSSAANAEAVADAAESDSESEQDEGGESSEEDDGEGGHPADDTVVEDDAAEREGKEEDEEDDEEHSGAWS